MPCLTTALPSMAWGGEGLRLLSSKSTIWFKLSSWLEWVSNVQCHGLMGMRVSQLPFRKWKNNSFLRWRSRRKIKEISGMCLYTCMSRGRRWLLSQVCLLCPLGICPACDHVYQTLLRINTLNKVIHHTAMAVLYKGLSAKKLQR